jgi:hypothetical protein
MDTDIVSMESDLRAILAVHAKEQRSQARQNHRDMMVLISSLGHGGAKYRREAIVRLRSVVSEVYSAPRVADVARRQPRLGAIPGLSLDLTGCDAQGNPWDFNIIGQRNKAEKLLDEQRPLLLIGTPMCTAFSNIQNLNTAKRDPEVIKKEYIKACVHLNWCCHLYEKQMARGA